jgi:hypothetical protein
MRYDTPIYFQTVPKDIYDPTTGDHVPIGEPTEVEKYASVYDTQTQVLLLVYGGIRQGSKTIHLQVPYTEPFDHIRIGDKLYNVDFKRDFRQKQSFIVSEVP